MNYMEDGITFETKMGDGSNPSEGLFGKLVNVGKRALTGESIFMTHFTNMGMAKKRVSFAAPTPVKLSVQIFKIIREPFYAGTLFVCCTGYKNINSLSKKLGVGFFGGESFILQKLVEMGKHLFTREVPLLRNN